MIDDVLSKINLALLPDGVNHWTGRSGWKPVALVYHITDGDDNTVAWFHNPEAEASAHFTIDRDGTINQFILTEDTAWSNGKINKPNGEWIPWLMHCEQEGINPNFLTISIEHVGHPATGVTEVQILSTIDLSRYLIKKWGLVARREFLCRHSDFDTVTRSFCPGPLFPMERIIAALAAPEGKE